MKRMDGLRRGIRMETERERERLRVVWDWKSVKVVSILSNWCESDGRDWGTQN